MEKQNQHSENPKLESCYQCQQHLNETELIFMAQFQAHICKPCYKTQSEQIMAYKKAKPTLSPSMNEILQDIFLGDQDAACHSETLSSRGITAICVCGNYLLTPFEGLFDYKKYQIADSIGEQIMHYFDENHEWVTKMRKQNKKILFHCAAGVSRSASFVIAFLMKDQKLTYSEAYSFVKSKRSIICPNSGFIKQLKEYQRQLQELKQKSQ